MGETLLQKHLLVASAPFEMMKLAGLKLSSEILAVSVT
jgi:hypothetical protein